MFLDQLISVSGWQVMPPCIAAQTVQGSEFDGKHVRNGVVLGFGDNYKADLQIAAAITAQLAKAADPGAPAQATQGCDQGCARVAAASNSCRGVIGFDCSGLTAFVLEQAGYTIPTNSSGQRAGGGQLIPRREGRPGDIIGYQDHVAIYLGLIGAQDYLLEAPEPGQNVTRSRQGCVSALPVCCARSEELLDELPRGL